MEGHPRPKGKRSILFSLPLEYPNLHHSREKGLGEHLRILGELRGKGEGLVSHLSNSLRLFGGMEQGESTRKGHLRGDRDRGACKKPSLAGRYWSSIHSQISTVVRGGTHLPGPEKGDR